MRTYNDSDMMDLGKEVGIGWLTGESCAFSLRILFDLTAEGVALIERALTIRISPNTYRNYNSMVGNEPAIASIKMSPEMLREVLVFHLAEKHALNGEVLVLATPKPEHSEYANKIVWAGTWDEYREEWGENSDEFRNKNWRWRTVSVYQAQPHQGADNVHGFTGRAR